MLIILVMKKARNGLLIRLRIEIKKPHPFGWGWYGMWFITTTPCIQVRGLHHALEGQRKPPCGVSKTGQ